jgi:hypothetical protein
MLYCIGRERACVDDKIEFSTVHDRQVAVPVGYEPVDAFQPRQTLRKGTG